jgi:nondiscriminating aspartyl-tRNA synthetase
MSRVHAALLAEHLGEQVTLHGWLHQLRRLRSVSFLILRDRSGTAQVLLREASDIDRVAALYNESVLEVRGIVAPRGDGRPGAELHCTGIEVLAEASEPPPFDLFRPDLALPLPTLLDYAPLSLRHPKRKAVFAVAAAAAEGFRQSLGRQGFVEIHTPKLVAAATEGGANVFPVGYFGGTAYLAQSPQFYKQMLVGVFERVFEVGPVFRAEPHDTPRHLNEYVSLDAEMGFIADHREVMDVLRDVVAGMLATVEKEADAALELLVAALPTVPERIPSLHFTEAIALLGERSGSSAAEQQDLAPADELLLGEWARQEFHSDFLFIEGYPAAQRPFYTHPDPQRPGYTRGFDLLFRGLELVTGGQRLHRYGDYLDALSHRGINPEPFDGYLQAFRYGMPPHGGFAIGLERFVARLLGLANLREAALFPRDLTRLTP